MPPANDQLAKLLFNDPDSPRLGAKAPRLTIDLVYRLQLPVL